MSISIYDFPNLPPAVQQTILHSPALTPPNGTIPNLQNPPNRNKDAVALGVVCVTIASVFFLGRQYSRFCVLKKTHIEDYLGILAFLGFVSLAYTYFTWLYWVGYFVHQWNVTVEHLISAAPFAVFGLTITYSGAMLFIKSAILLEWSRTFAPKGINPNFRRAAWFMLVCNALIYIGCIVASAITCLPTESNWLPWVRKETCIDREALGVATSYFNVAIDLIILALPQRIIWAIQMKRSRRFGISLVFSTGLLVTACAIGRLIATSRVEYDEDGDATYTVSAVFMWSLPEVTCAMLVFFLPALPKAFTESSPLSRALHSIRSWTRLPTTKGSLETLPRYAASERQGVTPRPSRSQIIRNKDQFQETFDLEEMPPLPQAYANDQPSVEEHGSQTLSYGQPPSILKTTEVQQYAEPTSKTLRKVLSEQQHPWTGATR